MTIPLTPEVVAKFKDFLVNPSKYGCTYKPLHEAFIVGDHYEPQDKLFDAYIDYIQKPLPKVIFYIIMQEEFPELRGCDECDEVQKDGKLKHCIGKRVFKDCWRAEIIIDGQRYRHRSKDRQDCEDWLRAVKCGKIKPTDNKADWWRMEQHKDEEIRIDEIIVSQAEEAVLLYDYHQTGDLTAINDYVVQRLLPHMAYYCAHTLHFGKDRTVTASREAVALLLTRITAGKPVRGFTPTCKRMLRVCKAHGNFFYYDKAPEQVKFMVDKLNFEALAEVWKVTKDRRL